MPKLEKAFGPTFANLISAQQPTLGLPVTDPAVFGASASCHRLGPGKDATGSGEWVCTVTWLGPVRKGVLHDRYDLTVGPDGCYTAAADGNEAHVGGATITTRDGATVLNLLYVFDGCFDTS